MGTTNPIGSQLLSTLTAVNASVSLGLTVGNIVVPLVTGLIKEFRTAVVDGEVEYTAVLKSGKEVLEEAKSGAKADLVAINEELVRLGLPPLAIPPDPELPTGTGDGG